jgi:hypothetical protein
MVYNAQNHLVSGPFPSSGILNARYQKPNTAFSSPKVHKPSDADTDVFPCCRTFGLVLHFFLASSLARSSFLASSLAQSLTLRMKFFCSVKRE